MSQLKKLLKYEFKAIARRLMPMFGAFLVMSILFGATLKLADGSSGFLVEMVSVIFGFLYVMMGSACVIMAIIIIIQRFYKNLLGNEGYLCFTLPVSVNAHIANKTISAVLWLVIGGIVGIISTMIMAVIFVSPGEISAGFKEFFDVIAGGTEGAKVLLIIVEVIIIAILSIGEGAIKIYAAISVGQRWQEHRAISAIAVYIAFGICESIGLNIIKGIVTGTGLSDYIDSTMSEYSMFQFAMLSMAVVAVGLTAVYWLITNKTLTKRLNLQ